MADSKKSVLLRAALVIGAVVCSSAVWISAAHARQNPGPAPTQAAAQTPQQVTDAKLAAVNRIKVDSFGDDAVAKQLQAMIINALAQTRKFVIVDQPNNNADATLRGAAVAMTSGPSKGQGGRGGGIESDPNANDGGPGTPQVANEFHGGPSPDDSGAEAKQGAGKSQGGRGGSAAGGKGSADGSANSSQEGGDPQGGRGGGGQASPGSGAEAPPKGGSSSITSSDTVIDVTLAVRLVAADGDVIWTSTKESKGVSDKGPIEDVANMIVAQLLSDLAKIPPPAKQQPQNQR